MDLVLSRFSPGTNVPDEKARGKGHPRVAVVGRPNVGKSTLVNALVGEERVIAFDQPGTTRDPIEVPFQRGGRRYTLIDTAGLRRRGKTGERGRVLLDRQGAAVDRGVERRHPHCSTRSTGITEQDAHVAGYILERGRALVLAVNKWDAADKEQRERMKSEIAVEARFPQLRRGPHHLREGGQGHGALMRSVDAAYAAAMARLATPKLTRAPDRRHGEAGPAEGSAHPPEAPLRAPGRHQPALASSSTATPSSACPTSYKRYLEGFFRDKFELIGTPMAIELRTGRNPYAGKAQKKRR